MTLAGGERERLTKHHTENPEAYQLYLKGRYHLNRLTDDGFLKGRDYFQQAIDQRPKLRAGLRRVGGRLPDAQRLQRACAE